jgi:hypothetical protein
MTMASPKPITLFLLLLLERITVGFSCYEGPWFWRANYVYGLSVKP